MRNLRAYLAGLGSSGAMIGAVIVGFLALGTIVGFNGLPSTSADSNSDTVLVEDSNAPEFAAAAAARPAGAPAATPARAAGTGTGAGGDGAAPATAAPNDGSGPGDGQTNPGDPGDGDPGTTDPPEPTSPPAPPPTSPPAPTGSSDVGNLAEEANDAVTDVTGTDLNLDGATKGITDTVDNAVGGLTGGRGLGLDGVDVPKLPGVVDLSP